MADYNQRLFSGGLRGRLHMARFEWLRRRAAGPAPLRVIELGCFDCRSLSYMAPEQYVGLDAGWEDGLAQARVRFAGDPRVTLIQAVDPAAMRRFPDRSFNLGIALETLEHVPPPVLPGYLDELARVIDGRLLVTVPNEMGPVFLAKYLAKRFLLSGTPDSYTLREIVAAVAGRLDRVERREHKGFDYRRLIDELSRRFEIVAVEGLPFGPPSLAFSVAITARSRA